MKRPVLSGGRALVIGDDHRLSHGDEEGRDEDFSVWSLRHRYGDDGRGRGAIHEVGEEREVPVLPGGQRLEGADVIRSNVGAHAAIPPAWGHARHMR